MRDASGCDLAGADLRLGCSDWLSLHRHSGLVTGYDPARVGVRISLRIQITLRCSLRWGAGHRAVSPAVTAIHPVVAQLIWPSGAAFAHTERNEHCFGVPTKAVLPDGRRGAGLIPGLDSEFFLRTCLPGHSLSSVNTSSAVAVVCALAGFRACRIAGRR